MNRGGCSTHRHDGLERPVEFVDVGKDLLKGLYVLGQAWHSIQEEKTSLPLQSRP